MGIDCLSQICLGKVDLILIVVMRRNIFFFLRIIRVLLGDFVRPNIFIVGTQKGGTSSLYDDLVKVQGGYSTFKKEISYFNNDKRLALGNIWYNAHFIGKLNTSQRIDATPEYLFDPRVAGRIHNYNSEAKIVITLRNPVNRAYSAWNMYRQFGEESGSFSRSFLKELRHGNLALYTTYYGDNFPKFEDCVNKGLRDLRSSGVDDFGILSRGLYSTQVDRYYRLFGKENVCVLFQENLLKNYDFEFNKLIFFLGIKREENYTKCTNKNVRNYKSDIDPSLRLKLSTFYEEDKLRLAAILQCELADIPW